MICKKNTLIQSFKIIHSFLFLRGVGKGKGKFEELWEKKTLNRMPQIKNFKYPGIISSSVSSSPWPVTSFYLSKMAASSLIEPLLGEYNFL